MRISDWSSDVCSSDLWHMRSNVAVYHQWYDDIQRTVAASNPDGTPGSAVQNAAKAKVFGLELEQTIAPTQHLSLQLNYAYVLPEYDSWSDPRSGADQSKNAEEGRGGKRVDSTCRT